MSVEVLSYSKGSDLSHIIRQLINSEKNKSLRFVIPSRKDRTWWYERAGIESYGPFDKHEYILWTWQDIYEDICKFFNIRRRRVLSPPDHLLILKYILQQVLSEQPEKIKLWPGLTRSGFPAVLSDDIRELLNEAIYPEQLRKNDNNEPSSFLLPEVYSRYLDYLKNNELLNSAQIWTAALEILNSNKKNVWGGNLEIIFTGFLSFTHGQLELLNVLETACRRILILKPEAELKKFHDASMQFSKTLNISRSSGKILDMPVAEPGLEPEAIARTLVLWSNGEGELEEFVKGEVFKAKGFDSVGIMIPSGRENAMVNALERYGVPFNFESGIKISLTLPGRVLSSIRSLQTRRFPTYETAMLLTQPCFAGIEFDAARAFRSGPSGLESWVKYLESQEDNEICNAALLAIKSIEVFCKTLSHKNTPAEIMRAFHEFLTVPGLWFDRISAQPSALDESVRTTLSAIQTVHEKVLALDELLPDTGPIQDEKLKGDDAFDFLESWCRNSNTRPPLQLSNAVKVFTGNPPVLASFPVWIMLDITQKSWSGSVTNSPLLGPIEREQLAEEGAYLPTNQDKADQREALFRRLLQTGENVTIISHPELDEEDRPISVSPFVQRFISEVSGWSIKKTQTVGINILLNGDGYFFPEIDPEASTLRTAPVINDRPGTPGASDLYKFLSCPFAWWLSRQKIYDKNSELATPVDWGNMAHALWQCVWQRYMSENIKGDKKFFIKLVNDEWEKLMQADPDGTYKNFLKLTKDWRLKRHLEGVRFRVERLGQVQGDILDGLHDEGYFHKKILLEEDAQLIAKVDGFNFLGQCDRIEILSDSAGHEFAVITDYKDNKSEVYEREMKKISRYRWNFESRDKFKFGLQISAYAALFSKCRSEELAGVCFLGLEDGRLAGTFEPELQGIYRAFASEKKKLSSSISERSDEGEYAMRCAAGILKEGIFAPDYKSDYCKYCRMKSICRRGEFQGESLLNDDESDKEEDAAIISS